MDEKFTKTFIGTCLKKIVENAEEYRAKNVNKYYREKELEHGGVYPVLEKYKNRVRVVDIFLEPAKILIEAIFGPSTNANGAPQKDIP